jgi:hypothetical protein
MNGSHRTLRPLLVAGLALAALAPVAALAAPPGQQRALSIGATPNPVVFGRTTVISGKLTGKNHAGRTVTLQGDEYPYGTFANLGTAVTSANGDYAFSRKPPKHTLYRVRMGGVQSSNLLVHVRIAVSLRLSDYTPGVGQRVRFAGRACPEHDGNLVAIQRRTRTGKWRTLARTHLRAATRCSTYRRRIRVFRDGTFRAVVRAEVDRWRGFSRRRFANAHR